MESTTPSPSPAPEEPTPTYTPTPTSTSTPTNTPTPTNANVEVEALTATAVVKQAATVQANQTATAVTAVTTTAMANQLSPIRLINPPNEAVFEGGSSEIVLQWVWDGRLQEGEYFFIEARFTGVDQARVCASDWLYFKWTKETSVSVDPWLYDAMCPSPTERTVQWIVSVAKPIAGLEEPDRVRLNPVSEVWRFQWLQGDGGDIQGTPTSGRGIIRPP